MTQTLRTFALIATGTQAVAHMLLRGRSATNASGVVPCPPARRAAFTTLCQALLVVALPAAAFAQSLPGMLPFRGPALHTSIVAIGPAAQDMVDVLMLGGAEHSQVFRPIVECVVVDMVDVFRVEQRSTDGVFGKNAVLVPPFGVADFHESVDAAWPRDRFSGRSDRKRPTVASDVGRPAPNPTIRQSIGTQFGPASASTQDHTSKYSWLAEMCQPGA